MKPFLLISSFVLALAATAPASAHITLQTDAAAVGSYYKAVLRVPHGCKGAATTAIKIRIPEGVISVKPQPKVGWTRSEEHTSELQSLMRISYAVFCLKKKRK